MRKDDDMLNNIFLDTEFEKKITEMAIEAIEANDVGASLVPLQVLLYINSVKAFVADSTYAQNNANGISSIANKLSTVVNSLSTISTQLASIDTSLKSIDKKTV